MSDTPTKMTFDLTARRIDPFGSTAHCKDADILLNTDLAGRRDAFNPAELLLAALSACMLKGIERVTPILNSSYATSKYVSTVCARMCRHVWSRSTTRSWSIPTRATIASNCCTTM